MQSKRKTIPLLILSICLLVLQGCSSDQQAEEVAIHPDLVEMFQNESIARRFQESTPQSQTAVDSAIELSEKFASLSEEAVVLRQQNQDIMNRNKHLQNQVVSLENTLQQTQKELSQANEILIDMRIELNNWKSDVLGFRDEMRNAEAAQLEALLKILQVLGGEVVTETAKDEDSGLAVASLSNSSHSDLE